MYVTSTNQQNAIAAPVNGQLSSTKENGDAEYIPANQSQLTFKERDALTTINPCFEPRWYQQESVDAIFNYFINGGTGHPLIVVPTGAGKSHVLGMFCKRVLDAWPSQKILILTHVDTIIKQDYLAIREHLPAYQVGVYSAGVGKKQRRQVTVAGIQSIAAKDPLFQGTTIILIDEAHTVPPKGEGQYRTFLSKFKCPIVGLTATHFRLGTGYLHQGDGRIFTDIAYEVDIERLIEEGYLCNLIPKAPLETIDMEGVHTQGGEFVRKEMAERVSKEGLTEAIVEELLKYRESYKKWLVFCLDIEHAEHVTILLSVAGISTALVHSKQPKAINDEMKLGYSNGKYQVLVSVESLTTGFDEPSIDLIALLRPTKSPVLHIQMIGRGLRISPGKEHCLVLDFAGNIQRLGPINDVRVVSRKKKKGGKAITKTCPKCQTICSGSVRVCTTCGHQFEFKVKLEEKASSKPVIKTKVNRLPPEWHPVTGIAYSLFYSQRTRNHLLMVTYRCGLRTFFEYKQFDPTSKARYHAIHWWNFREAVPTNTVPETSNEAVRLAQAGKLITPQAILVDDNGKYPEILKIQR